MSTWAVSKFWLYLIDILWALLFTVGSLCSSFILAMNGREWSSLSSTAKWITVAAMLSAWTTTMGAYLKQIRNKLDNNKPPMGDTETITK